MPWERLKGLLPGRTEPGRGGRFPGLATCGLGACVGAGAGAGFGPGRAADCAAVRSAAFSITRAWRSATLNEGSAACVGSADSAGLDGAGFGPGFGRVDVVGAASAASLGSLEREALSASNAARNLRATGGSMLDEGPLTNSPSSLSFASATLLSTPNSLATSCTRGFAATVLLFRARTRNRHRPLGSDGSHFEPLIRCHSCVITLLFSLFLRDCVSTAWPIRSARPKARRRMARW